MKRLVSLSAPPPLGGGAFSEEDEAEERFTTSDGQSSRESVRVFPQSHSPGSFRSAATWEGWELQGLLGFVVFLSSGAAKSLEQTKQTRETEFVSSMVPHWETFPLMSSCPMADPGSALLA